MKRANRSGSIYKLSGKRHKPWAVKVTTGYTDDGVQIRQYLGYFETKKEAQARLDEWTTNPRETHMTFAQAWRGWSESFRGSKNTIVAYRSAYKKATSIYDMNLEEVTLDIIQNLVNTPPCTYSTASAMKKLFSVLLEYGFAHDACPASRKALLEYVNLPERPKKSEAFRRFTDDEIQEAIDSQCVMAVVLLFTGLRRSEFLALTKDDIDLENQIIDVKASKTQAGVRRVPIPDRLVPWVKRWMNSEGMGRNRTYVETHFWNPYPLHDHRRHDCRHTYISILTESGTDERVVKALVGHAGGVTADVYTHYKDVELVREANRVFSKYLPDIVDGTEDYSDRIAA